MATVKKEQHAPNPRESADEADPASGTADFEQDERLRELRFEEWFTLVGEGTPIWAC